LAEHPEDVADVGSERFDFFVNNAGALAEYTYQVQHLERRAKTLGFTLVAKAR
jgi:hypothetical protein